MLNSFKYLVLFLHFHVQFNIAACGPIVSELPYPTTEELFFMRRYGYLGGEQDDVEFAYSPRSVSEAVKRLQEFAGVPATGLLDKATKELFHKKRCGLRDIEEQLARRKRYAILRGWNKRIVTYKVLNGSTTMSKEAVEDKLALGFAVWAPHGRLDIIPLTNESAHADIRVTFRKGAHGDGFAFDGPGQVVAHAFGPPHGGMHFDDDETWGESTGDDDVTDFYAVAVHEIGHALGLAHSNVKASVMYPYYQVPVEGLHADDITAMEKLYLTDQLPEDPNTTDRTLTSHSTIAKVTFAGNRDSAAYTDVDTGTETYTDSASEDSGEIPDRCTCDYDTMQVIRNNLYVFQEEWTWVLDEEKSLRDGFPKRIHDVFHGLPDNVVEVKAVYERHNGNVAIFSGRDYWEFDKEFVFNRKGSLADFDIPLDVPELSAVFISNFNNKTYFIEPEQYWRYDEGKLSMDPNYPKMMSMWRKVPYPINAAIIWKEDTYMFRGPRFWRFDSELVSVPADRYPLPTAQVWLACPNTPDMQRYTLDDQI